MQDVFGMQELLEPRAGVHRISPPPSFFPVNLQKIYKAVEKLGASELVSRQRPPSHMALCSPSGEAESILTPLHHR